MKLINLHIHIIPKSLGGLASDVFRSVSLNQNVGFVGAKDSFYLQVEVLHLGSIENFVIS